MAGGMKKALLNGKLLNPNDYLAAIEFGGRDVTLTIKDVAREELRNAAGGSKVKPVILFDETPRKLVLNRTNEDSIITMYGMHAEKWIGKRITLYAARVACGRDVTEGIRVREKIPPEKKPPQVPVTDHDEAPKPGPITAADVDAVLGGGQ